MLLGQAVAVLCLQEHRSTQAAAGVLGITPREARDFLRIAKARPLIRVTVTPHSTIPAVLDPRLSDELAGRSELRRAVVVRIPDWPLGRPDDDQFLHRQLGSAAAEYLCSVLRNDDLVAVGAGRGSAFTADAIHELAALASGRVQGRGLTFASITGGSIRRLPDGSAGTLDADAIADDLARAFSSDTRGTQLVLLPIAMPIEHRGMVSTIAPHLESSWWKTKRVDICLVGLGVLGPKHFSASQGAHINAILSELDHVTAEVPYRGYPGAIAEFAHRFWLTKDLQPETQSRVQTLLDAINSKIVGVELEALDRAREKIVVAGGSYKYPAIEAMVKGNRCAFHPTTLVTDADTAKRLLDDLP